jgi:hypothetical protein
MTIPILVEPIPTGFCAIAGGPLDLSAEAASAAEAVQALQEKIVRRLERGAILIDHPIPLARPPIPILPLSENPLLETWLAAVETFRAEQENQYGSGASEAP